MIALTYIWEANSTTIAIKLIDRQNSTVTLWGKITFVGDKRLQHAAQPYLDYLNRECYSITQVSSQ